MISEYLQQGKHFTPQKIVGLDIDDKLIAGANRTLEDKRKKINPPQSMDFPISFSIVHGSLIPPFPNNVSFVHGNFLEAQINEKFDVILCLSTTKWIHLNWGDEGVRRLFHKNWPSYKRKSTLTPELKAMYQTIQMMPEQFPDYLVREMKFTLKESMQLENKKVKSFSRPCYVFSK